MKTRTVDIKPKFNPGTIAVTPSFIKKSDPDYAIAALVRHLEGQWGLCDAEDAATNDDALANGGRIMSVWPLPNEADNFWIITEADRSVTTILLPSDY